MSDRLRFDWERAMRGAGLRPMLRLFLMTLATYMDTDGGGCWPTMQALADDLGVQRDTVNSLKNEAVTAGWLQVVSKGGKARPGGGSGKTNLYVPVIPGLVQLSGDHPTVEMSADGGNRQVANRGNRRVAARRNQTRDHRGELPDPSLRERVGCFLADSWPGRVNQRRHVDPIVALIEDHGWTWDQVADVFGSRTDDAETMQPLVKRLERVAHGPSYADAMKDRILLGFLDRLTRHRSPHTSYGSSTPGRPVDYGPSGHAAGWGPRYDEWEEAGDAG